MGLQFFKNETPTQVFPVDIAKFLRTTFFRTLQWLLQAVLPQHSKVNSGVCSLIPHLHVLSILIKNLQKNIPQIIVYYLVTKQFLPCLNWLITCFRFQNMFLKNISCFRFWWKTYTKSCTNNYVISRVKRLFSPAFCGWSSGYILENGRMPCKQKYCIKIMAVKIPNLILFRFCLLCWLSPASIVAASCFNYIGPCR